MQPSGLGAGAFGVGDLLPFRFLEVVEGFYFFSRQGAVVDADVVKKPFVGMASGVNITDGKWNCGRGRPRSSTPFFIVLLSAI